MGADIDDAFQTFFPLSYSERHSQVEKKLFVHKLCALNVRRTHTEKKLLLAFEWRCYKVIKQLTT